MTAGGAGGPAGAGAPGTLRPYFRQANAIVMDRPGAITVGRDLDEAYNRMEAMEHASKITHAARVIGPVHPLPAREVDMLQALARSLGIPRAPEPCTLCNACPSGAGGPISTSEELARAGERKQQDDAIVEAVLKKVPGQK